MIISALKSSDKLDNRSPIHPDTASALIKLGAEVNFETGIGEGIFASDNIFKDLGLKLSTREEYLKSSDLVISNQPLNID